MENKNNNYIFRYQSDCRLTSLSVRDVGFQSCSKDHLFGPCIRDYYLVHYIISGAGYYIMDGQKFHPRAGEAFLIYPSVRATYYSDMDNPWEYYWVGFSGNDAEILINLTDFSKEVPVLSLPSNDILELFLLIYNSKGEDSHLSIRMIGYLYLLLSHFIEYSQSGDSANESAMEKNLKAAEKYILQNYQNTISVETLACACGISRSWLFRCFKALTNTSPKEYLTAYRIERAKILLQNSALSIRQISYSTGFQDELYFSKVFKKITGKSPSEYRKHFQLCG